MNRLAYFWERVRAWRDRSRVEREMDEELRFHVEMATERNIARGLTADEARRHALRDFGGVERHKEEVRDARPTRWLEQAWQDLRYAGRTVRRSPGFASAVILTLALGMASVTAIFSVVNGVLLRPLPFPDPDRLTFLGWDFGRGRLNTALTAYQLDFVRRNARSVDGVATYATFERELGDPALLRFGRGLRVSEDFFRVTGIEPERGRVFSADEERPGGPGVAIVSEGFARRELGGDESAIGRSVRLGDDVHTVIGVMPAGFRFPDHAEYTDILLPLRLQPDPKDEGHNSYALARARDGWSRDAVERDLARVLNDLREQHPEQFGNPDEGFRLLSFEDVYVGDLGRALWVLLAAVGCVLLIACANAANLLLARAVTREREIVVRSALGAGRGRIIRQLLMEGLALAALAGTIGVVVGGWSLGALLAIAPRTLPRVDEIGLDVRVVAFTAGIVAITGILFGLVAALPTARRNLAASLGTRHSGAGGRGRVRDLLVIAETAFAIVLLAGAGLLIASFAKLSAVDPGFSAESVLAVRFGRMPPGYDEERRWGFMQGMLEGVRAIPGVESAGGVTTFPLERGMNIPVVLEGRPDQYEGDVEWRAMTPGYLEALAVPIRRGRAFAESDAAGSMRVAIVNETFARRFFPDEDPIGKRVEIGKWKGNWLAPGFVGAAEIVGVVADVRELRLNREPKQSIFVPLAQWPALINQVQLVVRGTGAAPGSGPIRSVVQRVDPRIQPPSLQPLSDIVGASIREQRFQTVILAVFAGSALVLTAIGVFAVLSYSVRERSREIGVRLALGARPGTVMQLVVRRGMLLVGGGAAIGVVAALLGSRVLASMLYEVAPTDPGVFLSAVAVLLGIALVAAWIPARRAASVDPIATLRAE